MNTWLIFIVAIIAAKYTLDLVVSFLNLKALSPDLPSEFNDVLNQEKYRESQEYTRKNTFFALIQNSCVTIITLAFLLLGGFNVIDEFSRSFAFGEIPTGIIFTAILVLLSFILELPFSIYSTFVIEEQFGFNQTTVKTFVVDILKSMLLAIIIGVPVLALVLWFFITTGELAWIYCWFGIFFITLLLQFLAPVLIMPLFNKFSPLEEGELKDAIMAYASKEKFKIKGVFVMDGSKRSTKLNAFFTGFGKFKKIVFFDTLLDTLNTQQIVGVLAHEMGHYKHKHLLKMIAASFLQTGIMFFFLSLIMENESLFKAFSMTNVSVYASLVFFGFLYAPVSLLLSVIFNAFSRKYEFEADRYAANSTNEPKFLVEGLKLLSKKNFSNLTPHPFNVALHYSHPPVLERIKALQEV